MYETIDETGHHQVCPVCRIQNTRPVIAKPMLVRIGKESAGKRVSLSVQSGACCASGESCGCG